MTTLHIRPAIAGTIVRMPDRAMRPLAAEGETVDDSMFWRRRLLLGDVALCAGPSPSPAAASAPSAVDEVSALLSAVPTA